MWLGRLNELLDLAATAIVDSALDDVEYFDDIRSKETEALAAIIGKLFANFKLGFVSQLFSFE